MYLLGAQAVITFYSTIVHAGTVERDAIFRGNGESAFFSHDFATASARGSISVDQASFSPEGVSASGVLFSTTFLGKCRGTSSIVLQAGDLRDSSNHTIRPAVSSGMVTVTERQSCHHPSTFYVLLFLSLASPPCGLLTLTRFCQHGRRQRNCTP